MDDETKKITYKTLSSQNILPCDASLKKEQNERFVSKILIGDVFLSEAASPLTLLEKKKLVLHNITAWDHELRRLSLK